MLDKNKERQYLEKNTTSTSYSWKLHETALLPILEI